MTTIYSLFCVIVVLSNLFSAKLVALPFFEGAAIPAGVLTYPLTFFLSDLVTELYGRKAAQKMVFTAFAMAVIGLALSQSVLYLPAQDGENQAAFAAVFGMNTWIVLASLTAYLVGQILDVKIYSRLKVMTRGRHLWLRNNVAMLIAQIADTFIVDIIYLFGALHLDFSLVLRMMLISYVYKALFILCNTPFFYFVVGRMKKLRYSTAE